MNVLVAGGAGFIGSHLCDALIERGDTVVCADNLLRGKMENIAHLSGNEKFIFQQIDIDDMDKVQDCLEKYQIEYVYHLAANSDIMASAKDPQVEFECTMKTTWTLLSAMKHAGVKKMFFASTSAVYGEQPGISLTESETVLAPISYYGSCKMASEAFIHAFSHMCDMSVLVLRFPNVIGPRLTHGVIYDFIHKLEKDPHRLEVLGDGTQSKPYMHVYDLVKAILKFENVEQGTAIYNVGVESDTSVKKIAGFVCEGMGLKDVEIVYGKENIGWKGDVPRFCYNLDKVHSQGWKASMTSDEAVIETIREVCACRE